jgi:hypothetical protein
MVVGEESVAVAIPRPAIRRGLLGLVALGCLAFASTASAEAPVVATDARAVTPPPVDEVVAGALSGDPGTPAVAAPAPAEAPVAPVTPEPPSAEPAPAAPAEATAAAPVDTGGEPSAPSSSSPAPSAYGGPDAGTPSSQPAAAAVEQSQAAVGEVVEGAGAAAGSTAEQVGGGTDAGNGSGNGSGGGGLPGDAVGMAEAALDSVAGGTGAQAQPQLDPVVDAVGSLAGNLSTLLDDAIAATGVESILEPALAGVGQALGGPTPLGEVLPGGGHAFDDGQPPTLGVDSPVLGGEASPLDGEPIGRALGPPDSPLGGTRQSHREPVAGSRALGAPPQSLRGAHPASLLQTVAPGGHVEAGGSPPAHGPTPSPAGGATGHTTGSMNAGTGIALALVAALFAVLALRRPPTLRRLVIAPATLRPAPAYGVLDPPG